MYVVYKKGYDALHFPTRFTSRQSPNNQKRTRKTAQEITTATFKLNANETRVLLVVLASFSTVGSSLPWVVSVPTFSAEHSKGFPSLEQTS
mmetsp:Transcript_10415/g.13952  ORF Transcript_10415/g.13952 Transcript_10415/m.13952 type:complete len:91 (+) Transcript_10415:35-307(+)